MAAPHPTTKQQQQPLHLERVRMIDRVALHEDDNKSASSSTSSAYVCRVGPAVFHSGQISFQQSAGTRSMVAGYAEWLAATIHANEQVTQLHRAEIVYVAFQDNHGPKRRWLTPITRPLRLDPTTNNVSLVTDETPSSSLVQVIAANRIRINALPPESWNDPLRHLLIDVQSLHQAGDTTRSDEELHPHVSVHILQESTRDRLRVSGRIVSVATAVSHGYDSFDIETDLVMSLCPKYILDRRIVDLRDEAIQGVKVTVEQSSAVTSHNDATTEVRTTDAADSDTSRAFIREPVVLPSIAIEMIHSADTFWLSTGVSHWGATASHRGGKVGFVRLTYDESSRSPQLEWGDYQGNNMFHSLGNASVDDSVGVTFLDFTGRHSGSILQLSGHLKVISASLPQGELDHSNRRVTFRIESVRLVKQALPFRWTSVEESSFNPTLHDPKDRQSAVHMTNNNHVEAQSQGTEMMLLDVLHPQLGRDDYDASEGVIQSQAEDDVLTFRFVPSPRQQSTIAGFSSFHFVAGQYATFNILIDGIVVTRSWTVTSPPGATIPRPAEYPFSDGDLDRHATAAGTAPLLPFLDISVKRVPEGIASRFLHAAARRFKSTSPRERFLDGQPPILTLTLRGIEGRFVLPSAYWNVTPAPMETDRLLVWQGKKHKRHEHEENTKVSATSMIAAAPQLPPLRLTMWCGGIGVTPLLAIQRFALSTPAAFLSSSRFTWIYVCQTPQDVCFHEELLDCQRRAISSNGRVHFSIAFFFTRLSSDVNANQDALRNFRRRWISKLYRNDHLVTSSATGELLDDRSSTNEDALLCVYAGRPSLTSVSSFLRNTNAFADAAAVSHSTAAVKDDSRKAELSSSRPLDSYTHNNFLCGPSQFLQFASSGIEYMQKEFPGIISPRIKQEEFGY